MFRNVLLNARSVLPSGLTLLGIRRDALDKIRMLPLSRKSEAVEPMMLIFSLYNVNTLDFLNKNLF